MNNIVNPIPQTELEDRSTAQYSLEEYGQQYDELPIELKAKVLEYINEDIQDWMKQFE